MSSVNERISYVRGLIDGMKYDVTKDEGKIINAIMDVLDEISLTIEDVEEVQESLCEQIDAIDEDLADIEEDFYGEDDDDIDDTIECPHCNEEFVIDENMVDNETDSVECPNCSKKIEINWDCNCTECE